MNNSPPSYIPTGAGKTFTMMGTAEQPGIIPHAIAHIFGVIAAASEDAAYAIRASYVEIYNEQARQPAVES